MADAILLQCGVSKTLVLNCLIPPAGGTDEGTVATMGKHYVNEVGTLIQLNTGTDLTAATAVQVNAVRPDGTSVIWPGSVQSIGGDNFYVQYETDADDFNLPGTYLVQPYVTLPSGSWLGATGSFQVYQLFT